jgi:superfamily I DNA/RNA helicase
VVCRSPRTARRITERLRAAEIPARLVFDGRFFARGVVQVTTVEEVKGLEFDFVIIPDAGVRDYPNDRAADMRCTWPSLEPGIRWPSHASVR